ncbi:LPXTG cell wall anchor domain-containing protein [Glycomyces sp. L485]|uniref:LPXTG cell wall anchor domain-containing protein n=1 Tax=Glycomyces sp. L485 TaxID=2909235 RepID=UPI001F4BBE32|nr:LPXTG cell wall anchor domain-containing protein [Glycomyces sp. L485]MCH7232409.1 LPXTG cell wall anchor domain-containing protein [Glycomyces sp. L485]
MNRTLQRVLGLAGSVALGVVGAVAIGSAAQAHHTTVKSSTDCDEDSWTVSWSVEDWNWKDWPRFRNVGAGEITAVTPSNPEVPLEGDIAVDAELPYPGEGVLTATQTFSNDVDNATLVIDGVWPNGEFGTGKGEATRPTEGCESTEDPTPTPTPAPEAWAVSDCFGIAVTAVNTSDVLAEFTLTPSTGDPVTLTPETDEEFREHFAVDDPEAGLTVSVTADGQEISVFEWDGGTDCERGAVYDTCEGLEFELSVPEGGVESTYTLTPSEGDEVVVTLAPGESETVTFVATGDELTVYYLIEQGENFEEGEIPWEKPEDCEEVPTESESPSAAPTLPTTGSSMTIMVSSAAALVAVAAVLFLIARRRRAAADW